MERSCFRLGINGLVAAMLLIALTTCRGYGQDIYPVESFLDWTKSPINDASNAQLGEYIFEAGVLGAVSRAATAYPQHYGPGRFLDPAQGFQNLADESQVTIDALLHLRPRPPYNWLGEAPYPAFMPDWNHDGTFGDPGDFDVDIDERRDTAYFRYPCADSDGSVEYETTTGNCEPPNQEGMSYRLGVAQEIKVVNARGLELDATLWVPGSAFAAEPIEICGASGCQTPSSPQDLPDFESQNSSWPGVVFNNGVASRQEYYYWFATRMAREGYTVLTYDPAGQGESQGTVVDLFNWTFPGVPMECPFGGACRDVQDVMRWFVGENIGRVADLGATNDPLNMGTYEEETSNLGNGYWRSPYVARKDPAYAPSGDNPHNPLLPVLDRSRISLAGNSMGAIATLNYLLHRGSLGSVGADGQPLPGVVAAISLSGAAPTKALVPIQFQTSDYDGSPLLAGPTVFGVSLGFNGEGIGYSEVKKRYDQLRDSGEGDGPMALLVLEGGVHTDHAAVPFVPRTPWSISLASDYAADWLNCHARSNPEACGRAISPRDHLSRAFASEQDPDGPAGVSKSLCIQVPDEASLNQTPQDFVSAYTGTPIFDCQQP